MFTRDPEHWLFRFSPQEWIRAAMKELRVAAAAYTQRNARAGLAGCRRAAGMALNGALIVEPNSAWGRTYVDHVEALAKEEKIPEAVRAACKVLLETRSPVPRSDLLSLRSKGGDAKVLEATRDVMAHAYAVVKRHA